MQSIPCVFIIANPTAGLSAGRVSRARLLQAAVHALEKRGCEVELHLEHSGADVVETARVLAQNGARNIIAAGGDGTVNAVVNGLMLWARDNTSHAAEMRFGVLPMGTGNVFAFNLRIPKAWRHACRLIADGIQHDQTRRVDVGLARSLSQDQTSKPEDRYFLCMAGIGFDARVVEETSLRLKYVLRDFAYVLKTLQNVVLHQGTQVTLRFHEKAETVSLHDAWLVMVGNAASYAWAIKVTQHAKLDDGNLDVCLMPWRNKFVCVQQAIQILTGQHVERGIAKYWKTRGVIVESEPPVPVQLDGDEWGQTPVELSILPGALRVFAPLDES